MPPCLPSALQVIECSAQEGPRRAAICEALVSRSLAHPHIVQTYAAAPVPQVRAGRAVLGGMSWGLSRLGGLEKSSSQHVSCW